MVVGEKLGGEVEAAVGGHGSAVARGPDVEGSCAGGSVLVSGDVIAAEMEEIGSCAARNRCACLAD